MRPSSVLVALATVLVLPPPSSAQEQDELRWTPAKSMEFRGVQQTAISPDGSRVAYVVRVPVMEGDKSEYLSHIWLVRSDGTGNVQFTHGPREPKLLMEVSPLILEWFDRHLRPDEPTVTFP